ncbi:MAG: NAD(P)-dependent oxidoreductase, partial [Pseudomonas formosensis]|nr:NAD(P)-dependent oxidoreductase [Halopseudomonas formosensis]
MASVAFIGLGVMGYPMAGHLARAGHEVTVYNRTAEKARQWVAEHGGRSCPTPAEAATEQDFIMICVGNDNDLTDVISGPEGVLAGARSGAVIVDHTTASAEVAR